MEFALGQQARLTQQLNLTPQLLQSINILSLDAVDLYEYVMREIERNPVVEFPAWWVPRSCGCELIESLVPAEPPSMIDDLKLQLHVLPLSAHMRRVGEYLIDSLNEHGFLCERAEDIAQRNGWPLPLIQQMIETIQTFEPCGFGASGVKEYMGIQLRQTGRDTPLVMEIFHHYLNELAQNRFGYIAEKTGGTIEDVRETLRIIQSLSLSPGDLHRSGDDRPVIPEVSVVRVHDQVLVTLVNELPPLSINEEYLSAEAVDGESAAYLHREYARAKLLAQFIDQRNKTLLRVAAFVVNHQRDHFLRGDPPLPLTQEEVADGLNIHPSTVCRALSSRYYEFEGRVHSFKAHFPSRLRSGESGAKVKELIRSFIEQEDKRRPLSDQQITDLLNLRRIHIARRTVAKYREDLRITPTQYRKIR